MLSKLFFQAENAKLDFMDSLFPVRHQEVRRTCGLKFMLYLCEMLPNHSSVPVNLLPHIFVPAHQPDVIHQTAVPASEDVPSFAIQTLDFALRRAVSCICRANPDRYSRDWPVVS
jgi:hypothetical protein